MTESFLQVTGFDPLVIQAPPGASGRGISSVTTDGSGNLIFTLTDGQVMIVPLSLLSSGDVATQISTAITALGLGTASQHAATDFALAAAGLPPGGTPGQVLTKAGDTNFTVGWSDGSAGSGGVVTVTDNGDGTSTVIYGESVAVADNGDGTSTLTF